MSDEPRSRRHGTAFWVLVTLLVLVALYVLGCVLFWLVMSYFGPAAA